MEALKRIADFEDQQKRIWDAVGQHVPYGVESVTKYARALILMCPLQPGDKAELIDPPEVTQEHSWGWMPWKHLFVAGALVEVVDVDWRDCFVIGFKFYHESSYTSFDKKFHDVSPEERGIFWSAARRFRKVLSSER